MHKTPKILTVLAISFIIFQTFSFLFLKLAYSPTRAAADWPIPDLQIKIPGMDEFSKPSPCPSPNQDKMCVTWIAEYISNIYRYAVGVIGILAVVVMMIGGIMWITAFGNTSRVGEAKSWIEASITGLVLTLCSYLILAQVNPALLNLQALGIKVTEKPPVTEALKTITPIVTASTCEWKDVGYCRVLGSYYEQKFNEDVSICDLSKKPGDNYSCCCLNLGGGWRYQSQSRIGDQITDASPELNELLNCLRKNLPVGVGEISSISDSGYKGNLTKCQVSNCKSLNPPCQHACGSCHYGGTNNSNKSYAVDLGDEINKNFFERAYNLCKASGAGYYEDEGNHIHISTTNCGKK